MVRTAKYPLQGMLERLACSKNIRLIRMSPKQLKQSGIRLDEYLQEEVGKVDPDTRENPLILIGRNGEFSLSYLGLVVGYVGKKPRELIYHPEGIIAAENRDRALVLHAHKFDKRPMIYLQLVDKMMLRLLPKELRDEEGISIYDTNLELNHANLSYLGKLIRGIF